MSDEPFEGDFVPLGPDGKPLDRGRRMTRRDARSWAQRTTVTLGLKEECSPYIEWLEAEEGRHRFREQLRQGNGRDCNVAGDVVLYELAEGQRGLVLEVP